MIRKQIVPSTVINEMLVKELFTGVEAELTDSSKRQQSTLGMRKAESLYSRLEAARRKNGA